jgi:multicomponent Na+:H+ antiporter subunit D
VLKLAPVLPIVIPFLMAALLAALTKVISETWSLLLAIASALVTLVASLVLLNASSTQTLVYWFGNWQPRGGLALGISFTVDPIGAGLAAFTVVLTVAALVFSFRYYDGAGNHLHALLLVFMGAMCGFSLTGDLFNIFVFFELMSAAAFALCAYKTDDPGAMQGSLNFAVVNTIGAYFVLTGIALLYAQTGALNMAQASRSLASAGTPNRVVLLSFALIACGYFVKGALVPFHFWLADAHAVAPAPVCILFSGVMVELGLYAVARIYWSVYDAAFHPYLPSLRILFLGIGALTAVFAAIMCFLQLNLKRLLAFSTVSHVGVMTMGFGLFAPVGLAGTSLYALGHGLVKSSLFLCAGIFLHRFGTVDEVELRNRGAEARFTSVLLLLGALGLAGSPFSGLAAGDTLIEAAAKEVGCDWLRWATLFSSVVTSAAVLRAGARILWGWGPVPEQDPSDRKNKEKSETETGHEKTPASMFLPALLLLSVGLTLQAVPGLALAILQAAQRFVNNQGYAAQVLDGIPLWAAAARVPPPHLEWKNCLPMLLAIGYASLFVKNERFRQMSHWFNMPLQQLRALHSGHVADYVTLLTLGFAVYGAYCLWFIR